MRLGLAQIMDRPGAVVPFSCSVDLSDLQYGASHPVTEPVEASTGSVTGWLAPY